MTASGLCRACGRPGMNVVLDLGSMPLANALLTAEQLDAPEPTFPLAVAFCPGCSLLQLTESVPPEMLFRDYVYFSSFSDEMLRHCRDLAAEIVAYPGTPAPDREAAQKLIDETFAGASARVYFERYRTYLLALAPAIAQQLLELVGN